MRLRTTLPFVFILLSFVFGIVYPSAQVEQEVIVLQLKERYRPLKVDINTASAELITLLPGIGAKTAAKIVEYRKKKVSIRTLQELESIEGLGKRRIEEMRKYVSLRQ